MDKSKSLIDLANLVRCIGGDKPGQWDLILDQAEFTYNHVKNRTTRKSTFEITYTKLPRLSIDLAYIFSNIDLSLAATRHKPTSIKDSNNSKKEI